MPISGVSSASNPNQAALTAALNSLTGGQPTSPQEGTTQGTGTVKKHGGHHHKPSAPAQTSTQATPVQQSTYDSQGAVAATNAGNPSASAAGSINLLA